ncbi:hypothetical protein [Floridanema evergladense]|uniref:Uncharacterized protein n=1 Tax=Floridaenema evergladense BLCC-F167 TaxID=3153639 RepID=A0ABV4WM63_9CYAN
MGHLKFTLNTLLLAFFTIACQGFNIQSPAITTEKAEDSINVRSINFYPLAIANDHRGSGR